MNSQTNRSLALVTLWLGLGLAIIGGGIAVLALIVSRALPDSGAIGFLSFREGNTDIYLLDIGRRFLHNLTDNGAVNGSFAFSPDGTRVAFESNKDGNTELYMVYVECAGLFGTCGGIRQLTDNQTDSRNPVWSPDGRLLAYVSDVSFEDADNEIYVTDVETGEAHNLTNNPADDHSPTWSPDGRWIAFVSNRDALHNLEVYVTSSDGEQLQRLTDNESHDSNPIWSPDGNWIAYQSIMPPENRARVALLNMNGTAYEGRLPYGGLGTVGNQSAWTPDSRFVVAVTFDGETSAIILLDVQTGGVQALTDQYGAFGISLSPDGRRLAFDTYTGETGNEIYVVDASGDHPPQLAYPDGGLVAWWP